MFLELFKNTVAFDAVKEIIPAADLDTPMLIDPSTHTTPDGQGGWVFEASGGDFKYFKYQSLASAAEAYKRCPTVAAIINRKAQCYINGKLKILNSKGKEAEGVQAQKLRNLMKRPNKIQSWKQFEAQMYIYFQVFGFALIMPIRPFGFPNIDAKALWNIPPSWIDISATRERFTASGAEVLKEIVINFNGSRLTLAIEDLIIIKDITPSFDILTFPESKLVACQMYVNNIIGAIESRNTLINFRGAQGILTQDPGKGQFTSVPMSEDEKKALQKDFRRYGLRRSQFQVILTTASLKWQNIGYPTKDLMLMEEVEESSIGICGNLNFPPFILNLSDPTFNNMNSAQKSLYQDAVIPDSDIIEEQLNNAFDLDEYNLSFNKDFGHIDVLQENKKEAAERRKALDEALQLEFNAGLITLDEWLEELGKEPLPNGLGKVRASDVKNSNVPLAVTIGVGGVQGLIAVLTSSMSSEARQATLEIVFGLSSSDAARMSEDGDTSNSGDGGDGNNNNNESETQNDGQETGEAAEAE